MRALHLGGYNMDAKKIREYAEIMQDLELTVLEIKEEKNTLRLERARTGCVPVMESAGTREPAAETPSHPALETGKAVSAEDSITSPMVGMFYVAPAENADPFVQVGDHVKTGDTVCIIEAMKLMNEIVADKDGTITEVLAANGTIVEYGQPLFRIRKD
jgi:acetyl-CoA carboxylase biotin carboxyl carrier protein